MDVLRGFLTVEEFRGAAKAQAVQYILRERGKGGDEDITKARLSKVHMDSELRARARAWPNARSMMADVRKAKAKIPDLEAEASGLVPRRQGNGHSGPSDPTASIAMFELGPAARMRARAERKLGEARETVALGELACSTVSVGLAPKYGDMLRAVYIQGRSLAGAAALLGCTKPTAITRRDVALDWLDSELW